MKKTFIEMKLFQVKLDRLEQFEAKIEEMSANQLKCEGCISLKYFKRFYTIDGIELGEPPRELTRIVKCVKYYSYWEFDTKENYGKAIKAYFDQYNKDLQKLLIAPPHNVKRKSLTIMAFFVSQQWELQQMNHGYGHISALNAP